MYVTLYTEDYSVLLLYHSY